MSGTRKSSIGNELSQAMQDAIRYIREESEKHTKKKSEAKKVNLTERAAKRVELEKRRREAEVKKLAKLVSTTIDYLEDKPDYIVYHKASDHLLVFKKINFVMKKELPNNEARFQPREWHEDKSMWKAFVLTFISGAKVSKVLNGMTGFHIKSEDRIAAIVDAIGS